MADGVKAPRRSGAPPVDEAGQPAPDVMAGEHFIRTVGRRRLAPRSTSSAVAPLPDAATRAAWASLAQYRTRAPKGVFIYASHEAANRDRERWLLDAMRDAALAKRDG